MGMEQTPAVKYSLRELVFYALKLGTIGFGGPVALVGYMHRDLVETRRWFSEADYKEGLTLSQLMPGPLAAQLAIYLGFVHYRVAGATLVGIAFVLPSFLMVVALGWAYLEFGNLGWMQAAFYGVGPAVIGIICVSAYRLTRKTIGTTRLLWSIYLVSAVTTMLTHTESVWLFLGAGLIAWAVHRARRDKRTLGLSGLCPVALASIGRNDLQLQELLVQISVFFTKAGAFVFGSGLAIVPFLYGGVVKEYGWLNDQEFLDAVAVAMITPGPVVITVGFIGYIVAGRDATMAAGFAGASVAALATFLPCYLLTVLPAPYFKKHGKQPGVIAFVDGVTAAAIGALAGACVVLGQRTLADASGGVDVVKLVILCSTLLVLIRFKKLPEPFVVLVAAVIGLITFPLALR